MAADVNSNEHKLLRVVRLIKADFEQKFKPAALVNFALYKLCVDTISDVEDSWR